MMASDRSNAFVLSVLLHGIVIALVLFFTYAVQQKVKESPTIFELVAGEGDDYMATLAPKLGVPDGIKIEIPQPEVAKAQTSPIQAAPEPKPVISKAPTTPAAPPKEETIPNLKEMVKRKAAITQIRKEANNRLAQQRAEKRAREAAAKAKAEEAARNRRMTKADFDKLNKTAKTTTGAKTGTSAKVKKIDAAGILSGLREGSANAKTGGGGTALTREEGDAIDGYAALLAQKIKQELDESPGVGAGLVVEVEIRILASGAITGFRILKSSGSAEFDQAVKEAFAKMKMPPRPKGLPELQRFPIYGVE